LKKAFLLSIFFTIASIIISLWFKSLVASLFSKEDLAVFYTVLDLVGLFMLLFIGFRASMSVAYNKGINATDMLNLFRIIIAAVTLIGLASSFFILRAAGFGISFWYLALIFAAFAVYTYFSNQLGMYRLYADTNVVTILEPLALIAWFGVVYYLLGIVGVDALYLAAPLGMLTTALYVLIRKMRSYPEPTFFVPSIDERLKAFLKNSAFGAAEFVFGILILYLAVLFVGKMISLGALGEFQVVIKSFFMYFISIFVFPIVKFILPELSYLVEKGEFGRISRLNRFALFYAAIAGVGTFGFSVIFGHALISWLFGDSYLASYMPLVILSVALFFVALNTYQVALLKSLERFFLSMSVRAYGSLFFPIYAFAIHPILPTLEGVSLALVFSYATMALISHFFAKNEMKKLALKD
jgi:O-antigen/teichoic acid export membrane protein